jgi:hypothetical protein
MNPRTTQLLAILALILTFFAYRAVRDARPTYVVGSDRPLNFSVPAVKSLELKRGVEPLIRIEQSVTDDGAGWQLTAPVQDGGRFAAIEDLLLLLRDLESYGEGPTDLARCGLDQPRVSIRIETGSRVHELALGADHPSLPRVHALVDGRSVLVDPALRGVLEDFRLSELREDAVVGISPDRIVELSLSRPGEAELVLQRKGPFWWMEKPFRGDANPSAVEAWLEKLSQWAVIDYLDDPSQFPPELESPRAVLTLKTAERQKTIEIGPVFAMEGASTAVAVKTSDRSAVLIVAGSTAENLISRSSARLLSPYLIRTDDPRVQSLKLSSGAYGPVELLQGPEGEWTLRWAGESMVRQAAKGAVESCLTDLRTLRSETWQQVDRNRLQQYGFDQPLLEIQMQTVSGETEDLIVGSEVEGRPGQYYLWNPRRDSCAIGVLASLEALRKAPFTLRSQELDFPAAELSRILLSAPEVGEVELVRPNEEWRVVSGTGDASAADAVQQELQVITGRLQELSVARWLDPSEPAPDEDRHRIRIDELPLESRGKPLRSLYLGGLTEEGWIRARLGDSAWAFALAPVAGANLESLAIDTLKRLVTGGESPR